MGSQQHVGAEAPGLAGPEVTPLTDECPGDGRDILGETHGTVDAALCAGVTSDRKRLATLQAELAMRGYELRQGAAGALYIARWGLVREVCGIDAVERFARQVGALT